MRILFLDPFHGGSHAAVAEGYVARSRHDVTLLPLSIAGGWRWRMRGAAVTLARQVRELAAGRRLAEQYDLLVTTDMLDLATFLGLARDVIDRLPVALYMHENQLTYPLPPGRARDLAFPWINYTAALAADAVCFNSEYHRRVFFEALPGLPGRYHDHRELDLLPALAARARVLYPGLDLARLGPIGAPAHDDGPPIILWNSRWEYDKQPEAFFAALGGLERRGVAFRLIVAGEHVDPNAPEFLAARERFGARAVHWGYAPDAAAYGALLHRADVVVSTAAQEFFGIALLEAMYCGSVPIAPRRLSYPEIIPAGHHDLCLYDDEVGLIDRLAAVLGALPAARARDFPAVAARYDWARMAPRYDACFEQIAAERRA